MKEIPKPPGTRVMCPEDCRYRNRIAPFCGYCLPEVMKKLGMREGEINGSREEKRDRQAEDQGA